MKKINFVAKRKAKKKVIKEIVTEHAAVPKVRFTVTRDALKWLDPESIAASVRSEIKAFRKVSKMA